MGKRLLFVAPPGVSHINSLAGIAQELAGRGHEVRWATWRRMSHLLPPGSIVYDGADSTYEAAVTATRVLAGAPPFVDLLKFYEEITIPLAKAILPDVEAAIRDFEPDALLVDQHAFAGTLAARRCGLPWATSSPSAGLLMTGLDFAPIHDRISRDLEELQTSAGLQPIADAELSPRLVLLYTVPELAGGLEFPPHFRFVGPIISSRPEKVPFPWERLTSLPKVYVSLGSVNAERGARFFQTVAAAVRGLNVQAIIGAPEGVIADPPENAIIQSWLPQLELLPLVDAVVTHGGCGTVMESLSFGLPMVIAPAALDNYTFAHNAVEAGVAVRVNFNRVSEDGLRQAIRSVLEDDSFRVAAAGVRKSLQAAGGAPAAADAFEQMLATS